MENIIKILLVSVPVLIGIINEVKKSKSKKNIQQHPQPNMPQPTKTRGALSEAWGNIPIPIELPKAETKTASAVRSFIKKEEDERIERVLQNPSTYIQTKIDSQKDESTTSTVDSAANSKQDYTFQSIEEVRRGFIWGEILQRKY